MLILFVIQHTKEHYTGRYLLAKQLRCNHSQNRFTLFWKQCVISSTIYRDHEGLEFLAPKYHPKTSLIFTLWHLGRHTQAQKCHICRYKFLKCLFNKIFYWLTDWLMPSDKRNSVVVKATGSISSLFNVASSRYVPFRQPQKLQSLYHGSTETYLCSPLSSIPFSTAA